MEFIIIFVIAYFIIRALGNSGSSSNSSPTISEVNTSEYIASEQTTQPPKQTRTVSNTSPVQMQIKNDQITKVRNNYDLYVEMLKQYYLQYGDEMFYSAKLAEFKKVSPIYKNIEDIAEDLKRIRKNINITPAQMATASVQEQDKPKDTQSNITKLAEQKQADYNTSNSIKKITDLNTYLDLLISYYEQYGDEVFLPSKIQNFMDSYEFDSKLGVHSSDDVIADLKDTRAVMLEDEHENVLPPVQAQTAINTPPTQSQSILDEQKLLDYIKAMPVKWAFDNPDALGNKELKKLCTGLLNNETVSAFLNHDRFRQMESLVQKKRTRTPSRADYNRSMDNNILYELYEYSYLMAIFQVLENRKNDTLKLDRVKLWDLIQGDCRKRLENLEQEKRNNPAIHDMFQKYEYDTSKIKMVVNDYVEPREYDYIYASLRTSVLLTIILDFVLSGEVNDGNGYRPTLEVIKQYSANDVIAALDAYLSSLITYTLGTYANGGRLPRKPR